MQFSATMRGYPVYRMNPETKTLVRVGSILEMRRSRRSMNRVGLAKLAQKVFASPPGEIIIVGADSVIDRCGVAEESVSVLSAG